MHMLEFAGLSQTPTTGTQTAAPKLLGTPYGTPLGQQTVSALIADLEKRGLTSRAAGDYSRVAAKDAKAILPIDMGDLTFRTTSGKLQVTKRDPRDVIQEVKARYGEDAAKVLTSIVAQINTALTQSAQILARAEIESQGLQFLRMTPFAFAAQFYGMTRTSLLDALLQHNLFATKAMKLLGDRFPGANWVMIWPEDITDLSKRAQKIFGGPIGEAASANAGVAAFVEGMENDLIGVVNTIRDIYKAAGEGLKNTFKFLPYIVGAVALLVVFMYLPKKKG